MWDYWMVAFFAFIGGSSRYALGILMPQSQGSWATLIVNLLGCFGLAYLHRRTQPMQASRWILGLGVGFMGAFTTFSSYNLSVWQLWLHHQSLGAVGYVCISLIGGLLMAAMGWWCAGHVERLGVGK